MSQGRWAAVAASSLAGVLAALQACTSPTSPPASPPTTAAATTTTTTQPPAQATPLPPPAPTCNGDTRRPAIEIVSPAADTRVTGRSLTIEAAAGDNVGVTKVDFLYHIDSRGLDGAAQQDPAILIGTREAPPYRIRWSVPQMCLAKVTLLAWAYDACDNVGESPLVRIEVCN